MDTRTAERAFLDWYRCLPRLRASPISPITAPCLVIGCWRRADIVGSTDAIAAGRYKSVNIAGASVISALLNQLDRRDLPFVFGGDGALVAFPGIQRETTRSALAAVQAWVADELELDLRAAIMPMEDVRAEGLDVRVARFKASDHVSYAMFAGGGASWAESEMKAGRYRVEPAAAGTRPDLTGLSCRWNPIEARAGEIVSIIAIPREPKAGKPSQALVSRHRCPGRRTGARGPSRAGRRSGYSFPPTGLELEARALAPKGGRRLLAKLSILAQLTLTSVSRQDRMEPRQFQCPAVQARRGAATRTSANSTMG